MLEGSNTEMSDTICRLTAEVIAAREDGMVQNMLIQDQKEDSKAMEKDSSEFLSNCMEESATQIADLKILLHQKALD